MCHLDKPSLACAPFFLRPLPSSLLPLTPSELPTGQAGGWDELYQNVPVTISWILCRPEHEDLRAENSWDKKVVQVMMCQRHGHGVVDFAHSRMNLRRARRRGKSLAKAQTDLCSKGGLEKRTMWSVLRLWHNSCAFIRPDWPRYNVLLMGTKCKRRRLNNQEALITN